MNLNAHITHLSPENVLIYINGTNDITVSNDGITSIEPSEQAKEDVISHSLHTNIMMVTIPKNTNATTHKDQLLLHAAIDLLLQSEENSK